MKLSRLFESDSYERGAERDSVSGDKSASDRVLAARVRRGWKPESRDDTTIEGGAIDISSDAKNSVMVNSSADECSNCRREYTGSSKPVWDVGARWDYETFCDKVCRSRFLDTEAELRSELFNRWRSAEHNFFAYNAILRLEQGLSRERERARDEDRVEAIKTREQAKRDLDKS